MNLYIYAYPAQMITFQLVDYKTEKILNNDNCAFQDVIRTMARYLRSSDPIYGVYVVGDTAFADKIYTMLKDNFQDEINIERAYNA